MGRRPECSDLKSTDGYYMIFGIGLFGIWEMSIWYLPTWYLVFVCMVFSICLFDSGFQRWIQLVRNAVIWRPSMTAASMFGSVRSFWRGRMMRICASPSSFFTGRCLNTTQASNCKTLNTNLADIYKYPWSTVAQSRTIRHIKKRENQEKKYFFNFKEFIFRQPAYKKGDIVKEWWNPSLFGFQFVQWRTYLPIVVS